ncbi:methylated-DNA--[protein]-cysteine S-methyltransferase [Myroides injenensis]|uniref:methylated-DNA--[protein]-cysteine S-methyltransferase n=1 Tax=Myroides injenensis TaxID=1183151 RepID=UPI0002880CD4|nr:methylated-DNA--[protein]-cysteine S-methyltransferase [Myroides injenensis]
MDKQAAINYKRISEAIDFIQQNFKTQPSLEDIAASIHLSPAHFQRLFSEWAGTTPKKFLQYISVQYAKQLLADRQATLFDTAIETGLSSTSRLHDLFINIEGMTPAEYKNGGKNLVINYSYDNSQFGAILIASTDKGVCYMAFIEEGMAAFDALVMKFPNATFKQERDLHQQNALAIFQRDWTELRNIKLHLKGTDFQLKVWETLLKIPLGNLSTYGKIADLIGNPKASRAVGTAIGSNPIAYLIPCHRVIQTSGHFGGYMWGPVRKTAIIGWETALTNDTDLFENNF